jgi:hypothetical protein
VGTEGRAPSARAAWDGLAMVIRSPYLLGILAIVFATMMESGAMIHHDNIVDTIKEDNL